MSEYISDEAVEAAEVAVMAAMIAYGPDGHLDGYAEITRAALEAAAPYMTGEAGSPAMSPQEKCAAREDLAIIMDMALHSYSVPEYSDLLVAATEILDAGYVSFAFRDARQRRKAPTR